MRYPNKITISELHEIDGLVMSQEVVKRYNTHETLVNEVERLQDELKDANYYRGLYALVGICSMVASIILIFTNHVNN